MQRPAAWGRHKRCVGWSIVDCVAPRRDVTGLTNAMPHCARWRRPTVYGQRSVDSTGPQDYRSDCFRRLERNENQDMKRTAICLIVFLAGTTLLVPSPTSATGQQSCTVGNVCASWYPKGSVFDGWAGNETDYGTQAFFDGATFTWPYVKNDTGLGRTRDSAYTSVCFYTSTFWNGAGSYVPYAGASWVAISRSSESHQKRVQSYC